MARFRPTELKKYLEEIGAMPKKGLSQNFLIDGNILKKIVALAEIKPEDTVLEIGPGPGALTEQLIDAGCKVIAIEKDDLFAKAFLSQNIPNLQVIHADVMELSFADLFGALPKKVKVVANLPYSLTTPILYKILKAHTFIESATLMVQEEVARRFLTPSYGAVNLLIGYYSKARYGFFVSRKSFYPAPRVDSAVIHLSVEKRFSVEDEALFFEMVERAFSMRRKTLTSSLREYFPQEIIQTALEALKKSPTSRPEELSLEEWVKFFTYIPKSRQIK